MKSAKFLMLSAAALSLVSAGTAFYTFYIARDYVVFANIPCDSSKFSCFIGDGENTPAYYAKLSKKAGSIPACNGWLDECPELTCAPGDQSCSIEYCEESSEENCHGPVPSVE